MRPDDERELYETIRRSFRPEPMDAARQAVFRRRVEEGLARRPRPLRVALPALATAAAAAALWFASPTTPEPAMSSQEPALYAFVDPDDASDRADDYLPEDYIVLAGLLELESDDR